ncbi:MAG: DNA translocase FtsK 4TM domain-containing protein, partial [Acidobacteria bacterium]|nr:DNA translocase FtsK 4TM domain-containing protein [Acidobacteriota bacterium]
MRFLSPTGHRRLNEAVGLLLMLSGIALGLSLESYSPLDPSLNTASPAAQPQNLLGYPGAYVADLVFQLFGLAAFLLPVLILALSWKCVRSEAVPAVKPMGAVLLMASLCAALSLHRSGYLWKQNIETGGLLGRLTGDTLLGGLNMTGAVIAILMGGLASLYLLTTFSLARTGGWMQKRVVGSGLWARMRQRWSAWRERRRQAAEAKAAVKAESMRRPRVLAPLPPGPIPGAVEPEPGQRVPVGPPAIAERPETMAIPEDPPIRELEPEPVRPTRKPLTAKSASRNYKTPPTTLLDPPAGRNPYDEEELRQTAVTIRAKLEEFNVRGGVTQINPGPVVTTFEYKPEAGVKYSRITNLAEDLCLGLQAESVLIERIPGKSTVGVEVPNRRREVISLREIIESPEFHDSHSRLSMALGKDINGRIRTANLDSMPHLLIAGSTGSGKSVLMNCIIMSILYKSTPDEVRFVLVDPKRLELGLYEDIPHLLTPVITDLKKAAYALRNVTVEMERRLKLLAAQGVRNIDQYNRKIRTQGYKELSLFDDEEA